MLLTEVVCFSTEFDGFMTGVVGSTTIVVSKCEEGEFEMPGPKLTKLELKVMETLWTRGEASIREVQEAFPEKKRPAYTTVQTTINRMEAKGVVRRVKKVGNFHVFAATVSRDAAERRLVDDLLAMFGGRTQPVMAHLIESGKLTLKDVEFAEKALKEMKR